MAGRQYGSVCYIIYRNASVIPSLALALLILEKRRNLYLSPSYEQRLLALPYQSRTATQKPYACICNEEHAASISCEITADAGITYPMGIYRCTILDLDMNFARIPVRQESARINAFFLLCLLAALYPRTGAYMGGLRLQK